MKKTNSIKTTFKNSTTKKHLLTEGNRLSLKAKNNPDSFTIGDQKRLFNIQALLWDMEKSLKAWNNSQFSSLSAALSRPPYAGSLGGESMFPPK